MHLHTGLARVAVPLLAGALLGRRHGGADGHQRSAAADGSGARRAVVRAGGRRLPALERENTCSSTQKPGAKALRKLLRETYGTSIGSSTTRACSGSDSGHEEGRAVDWMTDKSVAAEKAKAETFLAWLQARIHMATPMRWLAAWGSST